MEENILILTVGLPRSGKSTWARTKGYPIVCPDAIRLRLHGQVFRAESERLVWAHAHLMVESLFEAGHTHVILDATNVTRKRRDEWAARNWKVMLKVFVAPIDTCHLRADESGRPDLHEVIDRMADQWESPGADELLWD